jgi:antitoxin (DNA-binding transcriptional repressor) of toxin-antitoxin stability system
MRTVAIEELKVHFEEFLDAVQTGESLAITSRGKLIAELHAASANVAAATGPEELVRRGLARTVVRNDPSQYRTLEPSLNGSSAGELLDWVRGER